MKKKGFFGGSFDPIHFGHLNLAIQLMEKHGLDEVVLCPASISPHKGEAPPRAHGHHRLEMARIAVEPVKNFSVLDWEVKTEGPSYTVDTLRRLSLEKPAEWHLILGEDTLTEFARWKEPEVILSLAPPLIGRRPGTHKNISSQMGESLSKGMTEIAVMEISSTLLRDRLKKGKFCGHLVPAKVLDYIHQHHLY